MLKHKKGNVIVVVICVFAALAIALGSLVKTTSSRMHTTQIISNTLYVREFANTLSVLSINYLKEQFEVNGLKTILSKPLEEMGDTGEMDLLKPFKLLVDVNTNKNILELMIENSGMKKLKINKLFWQIKKSDFSPICIGEKERPYTCEKVGLIHIGMVISYVPPGQKNDKKRTEEYDFVSEVKVVANLLPVLSKFSLYIDDALDGDSVERFNVVDTNPEGELNTFKYKPWVLKNHSQNISFTSLNSYQNLLMSDRGFVFLGGGQPGKGNAIRLGLAFGDIEDDGLYGEGFQFFYTIDSDNEYSYFRTLEPWDDKGNGIMTANLGLCRDPNENNEDYNEEDGYNAYFDMTNGVESDKRSSIFRLYGTDGYGKSPTLVLGYVDSKYVSSRIFTKAPNEESEEDDDNYLSLEFYPESEFINASSYNFDTKAEAEEYADENDNSGYDEDLTDFAFDYRGKYSNKLTHDAYINNYSSIIETKRYNNSYGYVLKQDCERPLGDVFKGGKFKKLCKELENDIFTKVPKTNDSSNDAGNYQKIYPDSKLGELDQFINTEKLSIGPNGKRTTYTLTLKPPTSGSKQVETDCIFTSSDTITDDFIKFLKAKGLLIDNKLNLNGWLYINSDEMSDSFIFTLNLTNIKFVSHGGIILSKGRIRLMSDILSDSETNISFEDMVDRKYLTIMTLGNEGDIEIYRGVKRLDASLISKKGQIKLEGDASNNDSDRLYVIGNMVMKKIARGEEGLNSMRRGLFLNYNTNLSAIPYKTTPEEQSVLMFHIKEHPKLY